MTRRHILLSRIDEWLWWVSWLLAEALKPVVWRSR